MKMISAMICLSATLMLSAGPAFAAGSSQGQPGESQETSRKDECLLILKNCEMQADSLQQTIQRLNDEIAKGTHVYNVEELKKLQKMLNDANQTLDLLLNDKETLGM
jgi:TolA-binding protein